LYAVAFTHPQQLFRATGMASCGLVENWFMNALCFNACVERRHHGAFLWQRTRTLSRDAPLRAVNVTYGGRFEQLRGTIRRLVAPGVNIAAARWRNA